MGYNSFQSVTNQSRFILETLINLNTTQRITSCIRVFTFNSPSKCLGEIHKKGYLGEIELNWRFFKRLTGNNTTDPVHINIYKCCSIKLRSGLCPDSKLGTYGQCNLFIYFHWPSHPFQNWARFTERNVNGVSLHDRTSHNSRNYFSSIYYLVNIFKSFLIPK